MARKIFHPVTLTVEPLEERCTPAALVTPIQPPFAVMIVSQMAPANHDASTLVRTDLFGCVHSESAEPDPLTFQEAFAPQEAAPPHKSEAEPTANPTAVVADDAPAMNVTEPIAMCVVVEMD